MRRIDKLTKNLLRTLLIIGSLISIGFLLYYISRYLFQLPNSLGYFIGLLGTAYLIPFVSRNIEKLLKIQIDKPLLMELSVLAVLGMIFTLTAYINSHVDEYDNMLGGKYITQGLLPYKDFFSHHLPFPYHLAGLITLISGADPLRFRFIYLVLLFTWLTYIYFLGKPVLGKRSGLVFLLLVTLISVPIWSNMIFAEVLIGYSALHLSILYLRIKSTDEYLPSTFDLLQVALVGFIPGASSLGFVLLTIFYYIFFLFLFISKWRNLYNESLRNSFKQIIKYGLLLSIPSVLLLTQLVYTNSLNLFIEQGINFNREIYSHFHKDIPTSPLSIVFSYVLNIHDTIAFNIKDFVKNPQLIYPMIFRIFSYSLVIVLVIKRRYESAIFFFITFVLLNGRQGSILSVDRFHEIQSMLFAILSICLLMHITRRSKNQIIKTIMVINIIGLFLLVGFLFDHNRKALVKLKENRIPDVISLETELNKEINNNENIRSVWIGPQSLEHLFFLEKPLATSYYFWLPWHGDCEECKKKIIKDFEKNKPELVYWDNDFGVWGYNSSEFGDVINEYLEENYIKEDDNLYRISR